VNFAIVFIGFTGLFLPLLILFFNKGYKSANRFLSGFLFISSLYLLQNFFIFYSQLDFWVAFSISTQVIFYLIGPFSFFYIRSILHDNSMLKKWDYCHFLPFIISLVGLIPFLLTSWDYKLEIVNNMKSDDWDLAKFQINFIVPHKIDQALHISQMFFYAVSHWFMLITYRKKSNEAILNSQQYKLIRNWLLVFCVIFSLITINFIVVMFNVWIFDNKTVFLNKSNDSLLFAALVYVSVNMAVLSFPQIMYGLPMDRTRIVDYNLINSQVNIIEQIFPLVENIESKEGILTEAKIAPQLFSNEYLLEIENALDELIYKKLYLDPDFKLANIFNESKIPVHHLTYYFNNVRMLAFSEWRNNLRVEHAIELFKKAENLKMTIEAVSLESGFTSQSTFIRSFKNVTGFTPSDFLKKIHHQYRI
jgi:AraC-like DNA-binding protein